MAKKVNISCFSNGSEMECWKSINCDRCYKAPHSVYSEYDGFDYLTKCRCSIYEQIMIQYMGNGNEPISKKTHTATSQRNCPYRHEHWPKRNGVKKDKDKSLILKFD